MSKYNIDEIRAGGRNLGVALVAGGFIGVLFERNLPGALAAIVLGAWVFFKASETWSDS
ncbi:MAG: hypothetical protein IBGAMO2_200016 [Arenicellales bacterium IbO2]|nr:hypothetical protein [Gammaproteobacteria bacterium]MDA7962286.1 hypothetical protein [Gammaproteobacteria bacterium]MDA7990809.1 hypothetical protein [Gammaproteobacteria bacterium]MDA7996071.1 hypothetical protein [Gammaproteobacteria bacterium]CAJ2376110.1 MAG: hypothetical protein IBGAMO2_200016 [Arenicellales bacterium IbO2]